MSTHKTLTLGRKLARLWNTKIVIKKEEEFKT